MIQKIPAPAWTTRTQTGLCRMRSSGSDGNTRHLVYLPAKRKFPASADSMEQAQAGMKEWNELMHERGTRREKPMKPQVVAHELNKLISDDVRRGSTCLSYALRSGHDPFRPQSGHPLELQGRQRQRASQVSSATIHHIAQSEPVERARGPCHRWHSPTADRCWPS